MADSLAFTVLAIMAARDDASAVVDRVVGKYTQFDTALKRTADTAKTSGTAIDESLLQTASGADALDVATARVEAAQAKLATATTAQADAEKELLSAQAQVAAGADGDAAAMDKQVLASDALTKAQKDAALAAKGLRDAQASQAAIADAAAGSQAKVAQEAESSGGKLGSLASTVGKVGLGLGVAGGLMVKSAADFQSSTTVLQTSGGETAAELDKARSGILGLAGSTGTATQELTNGLYMLGSAGFTVSKGGLQALQAAAQGAKAENADLGTVSNALSTELTDYNVKLTNTAKGQQIANSYMDQTIAIVQNGKTTTEALAASLSNVLPIASSVGLSFAQVGGAMATMTGQGESADQASQNLANAIRSLSNPNAVATKEMAALGLNANDVSKNLGKVGLTGTIDQLTGAITAHMGPSGLVIQNAFQNAKAAAADANAMIAQMPKNLQTLAQGFLNGSISAKTWKADLQGLPPVQQHLMQQFATTADKTHSFNDLLAAGGPAAQTYQAALAKMTGGATGLNVALMLGGDNAKTFHDNVAKVAEAGKTAGQSVDGWQQIQGTFNQKIAEAKESLKATGIAIGTGLLPAVTTLAGWVMKIVEPVAKWAEAHQHLAGIILGSVAGFAALVGVVNLGAKAFGAVKNAVEAVTNVFTGLGKLLGIVKTANQEAATAAGEEAAATDTATVSVEASTAAAEENAVAANASSTSWLRAGLTATGSAVKFMALKVAQLAGAAATGIATAATWAFNAAMAVATSPITLVVLAIAALVAGFIYLWNTSKGFRDFWKDLWRDIKTIAVDVWHALDQGFHDMVQWIKDAWHAVQDATRTVWDWIKAFIGATVNEVKAVLAWFGRLPGMFEGWLRDAANAVSRGIDTVVRFFEDLPSRVLGLLKDAGSWLVSIGEDIIKGLGSGIDNMVGWVEDKVKSIGGTIVKGFKSVLSIFSPSRVMADEVGKYIPLGIAAGITNNLGAIQAAAKTAGNVTVTSARTGIDSAGPALTTTLPAAGVGASSGGVHIHMAGMLDGAYIVGDAGVNQLVEKIGRAVATKLGPQAGLRVAM